MVLLLIRGDNYEKIKNALADIHRHAKLTIIGKPKIMVPEAADELLKYILGDIKKPCKKSCLVKIEENAPRAIDKIRKIHPPAHIVVISEKYEPYPYLIEDFPKMPPLKGYYKSKESNKDDKKEKNKDSKKQNFKSSSQSKFKLNIKNQNRKK
ncbi:DUF356 domain-containing protein [Methanothermococcus sp.]|uniref:DUF356 domain-containing protein n=1 Tax=Methanothermococcus sp. TaxID=2614238 RepID=UPI0025CE0020|nr:DUF356 domain-containing protein [Methanothermococcus sp.]